MRGRQPIEAVSGELSLEEVHRRLLGYALEASDRAAFLTRASDGTNLAVNDAACRLLGYSREVLSTFTPRDLSARTTEQVDAAYAAMRERGHVQQTALLRRADGAVVEIGYRASSAPVDGGEVVYLTITDPIDNALRVDGMPAALDRDPVRAALVDRVEECWLRLEDVVSELTAVHGMSAEETLGQVMRTIAAEQALEA